LNVYTAEFNANLVRHIGSNLLHNVTLKQIRNKENLIPLFDPLKNVSRRKKLSSIDVGCHRANSI
jgi:hypothetical protein